MLSDELTEKLKSYLDKHGYKYDFYLEDKYHDSTETKASRLLFDLAGVKYEPYVGRYKEVIVK